MKLYQKNAVLTRNLRTGMVTVCLLFAMGMLTGCGTEDKLLSELRREDTAEGSEGAGESGPDGQSDAEYAAETGEQGFSVKELLGISQRDGNEAVGETGQGSSIEEIWKTEQSIGAENAQNSGQSIGSIDRQGVPEAEKIYVHVCGAVKSPGVYTLPEGSRFYEAVEMAGGFTEDACQDYLNMAAPLADGSRLEIPALEAVKNREEAKKTDGSSGENGKQAEYSYYSLSEKNVPASDGENAKSTESPLEGLVNINTADAAELCSLPGIGEGRAKAIIEYREKQGGFRKKEDIMQVSGIGEKMYARMEAYLTVE